MKNILFAIIITIFSCVPLVQASQEPRLKSACKTEDGLLSYQGTLWIYKGGIILDSSPGREIITFEEKSSSNPRYMELEKYLHYVPHLQTITKTITNSSNQEKVDTYEAESTEFKELNKIFEFKFDVSEEDFFNRFCKK